MNYQTWSKKQFWGFVIGIFLLGFMVVPMSGAEMAVQEPQPRTITKTEIKEVKVADREGLQRLAELDQRIFDASAEVIDAQGTGLQVAGRVLQNLDTITVAEIEEGTAVIQTQRQRIHRATDKLEQLQAERQAMLTH